MDKNDHIAKEFRPWMQKPLDEWDIVGMNHYRVNGERFIFVAMVKLGYCIKEKGKDDKYLWNRLWHKANTIYHRYGEEI